MKFILYTFKKRKDGNRKDIGINVERVLFLSFIVTFVLMVIVQAALMNPTMRTFLVANDELEGLPLETEEYLYKKGELTLELLNSKGNSNIKVLVNGDAVSSFTTNKLSLNVKEGDVVEIDGSNEKSEVVVVVTNKSENIITDCVNKGIKVKSNVRKLLDVKIQ